MKVIMILPYSSLMGEPCIYGDGYHVRTAREIWKRSHKYQLECWRPERKLKRAIIGERDGIIYRTFPSWRLGLGGMTKFVYKKVSSLYAPLRWGLWREYSPSLVRALRKECSKGNVLVLLYHVHFDMSYLICMMCKNIPLVASHIGGIPYAYNLTSWLSNLPLSLLEHIALGNVDVMMVGTEWHANGFNRFYKKIPKVVYPMPQCVDFDMFKPMDKAEARKAIGIGSDKKVIIHVGRFDYAKGFDTILDILPILKKEYDIEFIAIGGTKNDMLYKRAVDSGVKVFEWMQQKDIVKYYNASDVYLYPKFYGKESEADTEKYGGAGVASVEALACGIPVIGTNLKGFFATPEELKEVGLIPKNKEDLAMSVSRIFDHSEHFNKCRQVAMKYYDWTPRVERLLSVFDELGEKYYGR